MTDTSHVANGNGQKMEKIAKSASLMVTARLAMIVCAVFGPMLAAWFINRILTNQDRFDTALSEVAKAIALVTQKADLVDTSLKNDITNNNLRITDHEVRIRELERPPTITLPPRVRP